MTTILETVFKDVATSTLTSLAKNATRVAEEEFGDTPVFDITGALEGTSGELSDTGIFEIAKTLTSSNNNSDLTELVCSGLGKVAGTAMGGPAGGLIGSLLGKYVLAPVSQAVNKLQTAAINTIANGIGKFVGGLFGEK